MTIGGIFVITDFASTRYKVSPMVEESKIECEFRAFCSDAVVVGRDGKLAAEIADSIIMETIIIRIYDLHASIGRGNLQLSFMLVR